MLFQIAFDLAAQVILALRHLQRAEESRRRLHLPPFVFEIVIQRIADPPGLRVGKELRKVLGTDQPSKERNDQRLLNTVFLDMVFHRNQPFFS